MEFRGSIQKLSPIIHILGRINPILRIDTYFFKIYSNVVLNIDLPRDLFSVGSHVEILKMFLQHNISKTVVLLNVDRRRRTRQQPL